MKRVVGYGAVLLLAALLLVGCGGSKKVAAKVNKALITEDDFNDRAQNVSVFSLGLSLQTRGPVKSGEYAMVHMIQENMWEQLGAQKGVTPTDADITAYVAFAKDFINRQDLGNLTFMTPDPTRSEADWRRDAKTTLIQRGLALAPLKLSQTDLQKEYDQAKQRLTPQDRYHLRVIAAASPQKAQEALDALKKGVAFDVVALKQSQDPGSQRNGGDIGIKQQSELPPDLLAAVKDLKPNEYSPKIIELKPMNVQPGAPPQPTRYILAQLIEKLPGRTPSLEESRFALQDYLLSEKDPTWVQRVGGDFEAFRKAADIDIKLKPYEHLRDLFKGSAAAPAPAASGAGAVPGAGATPGMGR